MASETEFPHPDRQIWLRRVGEALAGKDFATLVSSTDDAIRIEPLYDRAVAPTLLTRRRPAQCWTIVQRIDDINAERANRQALDDAGSGATGLSIAFEGAPAAYGFGLPASEEALERALDGIAVNRVHLRIETHPGSRASSEWLTRLLTRRRADPARLSIALGIDPAAILAGTGRLRVSIEALEASMPQSLAHFFALGLPGVLLEADGRVFHNGGATEAQELGIMIASAASYLRMFEAARQPLHYAVPHIGFALAVDQDQFLSIAKIRALRLLWARMQEACGIERSATSIHAETSYRMLARRDPDTNILRNAIAAFAAAAGGADSISVLPHTLPHGLPDALARRIARNTQIVLSGEVRLDIVADPASGSGAVETLTQRLCEAAWAELQRIEAEGGILRSLAAGGVQARIRAAQRARASAPESGRSAIVGTTHFPQAAERPVTVLAAERRIVVHEGPTACERLDAIRLDEPAGA
jgi:methylmalonyl-CoA mutase